ncbi:MAG: HAD-IG family 5'-nucleotidase, partial [Bdellovibrionales bacterium]|nr:HAD-IG family 5'-nucleotidase [Bdellovibrionales bacterium]
NVFVNRTLNLKKTRFIGFDMDHTLVRYNSHNFERLTHQVAIDKLIKAKGYPSVLNELPFEPDRVIRGLILDLKNGNLLKLNQFAGIRISYHGLKKIDFAEQKKMYRSTYIDLADADYLSIDTAFSVSTALLFSQLVDLKDSDHGRNMPSYRQIAEDLLQVVDESHQDGSLKDCVRDELEKYIIADPKTVQGLERFKRHGKKLFVITNSLFDYTKLLLDYTINPFLKEHKNWQELFDIVVTGAQKPRFFQNDMPFLRINPETGTMTNESKNLKNGVFQGGNARALTDNLGLSGEDILYLGDHIYGDIVRLKKDCNWRTGLVIEELEQELSVLNQARPLEGKIADLMKKKEPMEDEVLEMITSQKDSGKPADEKKIEDLQEKISKIDAEIGNIIMEHHELFNKHWGEVMRIGNEESYFAGQVVRYACVYMPTIADFLDISPRSYLRGARRPLPHED